MAVKPPKKKPNWSHVISIQINPFGQDRRTDIKTPSGLLVGQHDRYSIGLQVHSLYQPVDLPTRVACGLTNTIWMSEESRVANAAVLLLSAEVDTSPTKIQPAIQVVIITLVVNRRTTGLQGGHTDRSQRQRVGIHPDTAQSDQGAADGATLARNSP